MLQGKRRIITALCAALLWLVVLPGGALAVQSEAVGTTTPTMAPFDPAKAPPNGLIATSGSLVLQVVDREGSAMEGVTVALQTRSNATETDENGLVQLNDLYPGGSYEIFVLAEGFDEWSETYICPEDSQDMATMTVTLRPAGSGETVTSVTRTVDATGDENAQLPQSGEGTQQPAGGSCKWLMIAFVVLLAVALYLIYQLYRSWHDGDPWQPPEEEGSSSSEVIDIDWEAVEENGTENE